MYRSVLLRTKNFSDKICRENQNTHLTFNKFFFSEITRLWDNVETYCKARQVCALHTGYLRPKIHNQNM